MVCHCLRVKREKTNVQKQLQKRLVPKLCPTLVPCFTCAGTAFAFAKCADRGPRFETCCYWSCAATEFPTSPSIGIRVRLATPCYGFRFGNGTVTRALPGRTGRAAFGATPALPTQRTTCQACSSKALAHHFSAPITSFAPSGSVCGAARLKAFGAPRIRIGDLRSGWQITRAPWAWFDDSWCGSQAFTVIASRTAEAAFENDAQELGLREQRFQAGSRPIDVLVVLGSLRMTSTVSMDFLEAILL